MKADAFGFDGGGRSSMLTSESLSESSEPSLSSKPPKSSSESPSSESPSAASSSSVISRGFKTGGAAFFSFAGGDPSFFDALRTTPAADCTSSITVFRASFAGLELANLDRILSVAASRCTGANFESSGTSRGDVWTALIFNRHLYRWCCAATVVSSAYHPNPVSFLPMYKVVLSS